MPRRPRITLAGVPLHVIQRGNNRQAYFFADEDYKAYLHWLKKYAREHELNRGLSPIFPTIGESLEY